MKRLWIQILRSLEFYFFFPFLLYFLCAVHRVPIGSPSQITRLKNMPGTATLVEIATASSCYASAKDTMNDFMTLDSS